MNPIFRKLTNETQTTYDNLSLPQLCWLLDRNKTWRIFRNTLAYVTSEPIPDDIRGEYDSPDINKIIAAIHNHKKKKDDKVSPFNFISFLDGRQITYEIKDSSIQFAVHGKLFECNKVKDVPYYDTSKPREIGTCELVDGKISAKLHQHSKDQNPGWDSYKVDPLTTKHIFVTSSLVYIKNNMWTRVIPENVIGNVMSCFMVEDISAVADKVIAAVMSVFPVPKAPGKENVLQGDILGHYLYSILELQGADNKIRFCSYIARAMEPIRTKTSKGEVSIAAHYSQTVQENWLKQPETADLALSKKITYPAVLNKLDKVQSHIVAEVPFQAANQYEVNARAVYTIGTGGYFGVQVPNHVYENTKVRTDLAFIQVTDAVKYIVIDGVNQQTFVDTVNFIMEKPGVVVERKLVKQIGIVSSSVTAVDVEHNFMAFKDKIKVEKDKDTLMTEFIEGEADDKKYMAVRASTVYLDLNEPKSYDIVASSITQVQTMKDVRNTEYKKKLKLADTYYAYVFYYSTIMKITTDRVYQITSCFPHTSQCVVLVTKANVTLASWQKRLQEEDHLKEYHKLGLRANLERCHYFLTSRDIWAQIRKRFTTYQKPLYSIPTTYYRRVLKGSRSCVTLDDLEAAVDAFDENPEILEKIINEDAGLGMSYVQTHKPEIYKKMNKKNSLHFIINAIAYYVFHYGADKLYGDVENIDGRNYLYTSIDYLKTQIVIQDKEGHVLWDEFLHILSDSGLVKIEYGKRLSRHDNNFQYWLATQMAKYRWFNKQPYSQFIRDWEENPIIGSQKDKSKAPPSTKNKQTSEEKKSPVEEKKAPKEEKQSIDAKEDSVEEFSMDDNDLPE